MLLTRVVGLRLGRRRQGEGAGEREQRRGGQRPGGPDEPAPRAAQARETPAGRPADTVSEEGRPPRRVGNRSVSGEMFDTRRLLLVAINCPRLKASCMKAYCNSKFTGTSAAGPYRREGRATFTTRNRNGT